MSRVLVIPTLGTSPLLAKAVASAAQLPDTQRIIVCPPERVAALSAAHPECRVVAENGPGLYAAINSGVAAATGWEWCGYLNDDDLLGAAAAAEPPAGCDVGYGRVDYIDAAGRRVGSFPVETNPARVPRLLAAGIPAITPQGTWISRRAFATLGGFDAQLKFCGDFDFWLRAAARGLRFACQPGVAGAFRLRAGQLSAQRAGAAAELAAVCARLPQAHGEISLALARIGFRLRNLPLIWERRRLTGHWRSRDLFSSP